MRQGERKIFGKGAMNKSCVLRGRYEVFLTNGNSARESSQPDSPVVGQFMNGLASLNAKALERATLKLTTEDTESTEIDPI